MRKTNFQDNQIGQAEASSDEGINKPQETSRGGHQKSPSVQLADLLEIHRGERHVIVLQDYPDPDAIACAFAHNLIAEEFDIDCDIIYTGKVSHPQNLAMVRLLEIHLTSYDPGMDLSGYDGSVFVDNQGTTSETLVRALDIAGVPVLAVIDHHEPQDHLNPAFSDIRQTAAAATIYCEYFEQGIFKLDADVREHVIAGTALMLGLLTDTQNLMTATGDDYLAARFISQYTDRALLQKVLAQARPKHTMEAIHRALESRIIIEGFSIAGISYIRAGDRDSIPQVADFLMTEENVHTAIVYGILRDDSSQETVTGSMRTTKLTISPDKFLKEALGVDQSGKPYGGGKKSAGGFEIPLGFLSGGEGKDYEEMKWKLYDSQIKNKLFKHIGASPEES